MNKKKAILIRVIFLSIVLGVIIIGIVNYMKLGGTSPAESWRAKAGAIFFLIVFLGLLIKEIRKLLD